MGLLRAVNNRLAASFKGVGGDGRHAGGDPDIQQMRTIREGAVADGIAPVGNNDSLHVQPGEGLLVDLLQVRGQTQHAQLPKRGDRHRFGLRGESVLRKLRGVGRAAGGFIIGRLKGQDGIDRFRDRVGGVVCAYAPRFNLHVVVRPGIHGVLPVVMQNIARHSVRGSPAEGIIRAAIRDKPYIRAER